jgi:ribosome-binding factor A
MRHVPTLEFFHDALPDTARHLEEVLAQAREADAAVAAAAAGARYAGDEDPYRKPHEDDDLEDEVDELDTPAPADSSADRA